MRADDSPPRLGAFYLYQASANCLFFQPVFFVYYAQAIGLSLPAILWLQSYNLALRSLLELPLGALADRWSRRGCLVASVLAVASGAAVLLLAPSPVTAVLAETAFGTANALRSGGRLGAPLRRARLRRAIGAISRSRRTYARRGVAGCRHHGRRRRPARRRRLAPAVRGLAVHGARRRARGRAAARTAHRFARATGHASPAHVGGGAGRPRERRSALDDRVGGARRRVLARLLLSSAAVPERDRRAASGPSEWSLPPPSW